MTRTEIINKCSKKKTIIRTNYLWNTTAIFVITLFMILGIVETALKGLFMGTVAVWILTIVIAIVILSDLPNSNRKAVNEADNEIVSSIEEYISMVLNSNDCIKPSAIETFVIHKKTTLVITLIFKFKTDNILERDKTMFIASREISKIQQRAEKVIPIDLSCIALKD